MNQYIIKTINKKKNITKKYIIEFLKQCIPKHIEEPFGKIEYLHGLISAEIRYCVEGENDSGELYRIIRYCDQKHINIWDLAHRTVDEIEMNKLIYGKYKILTN